jgi:hypothetical protein
MSTPNESGVVLEGYSEFMRDAHEAPARVERAMRGLFRSEASKVIARAAAYAPKRTGEMAHSTSTRVGPRSVTITWTKVYAGVQEFAKRYTRQTKSGPQTVTMHKGEPPRFVYKAWNEMDDSFGEELLDDFLHAVAETGWWEVV